MEIKKFRFVYINFLFLFFVLLFLTGMLQTLATAQDLDTEKKITTSTDRGDITLKLLLYDITSSDPNTQIDGQTIVIFEKCTALSPGDPNLSPSGNLHLPLPWGDFPYGLWRSQISLKNEFDPNIHRIFMKIYFQGRIDPLNAQYWAQQYNTVKKKVEWKEFEQNPVDQDPPLFFPNVAEPSITIRLSDFWIPEYGDIQSGFGDRDPNKRVIDHVGGLLWPIPGGGRCFISHIGSGGERAIEINRSFIALP